MVSNANLVYRLSLYSDDWLTVEKGKYVIYDCYPKTKIMVRTTGNPTVLFENKTDEHLLLESPLVFVEGESFTFESTEE
jgi:hypothetical protein